MNGAKLGRHCTYCKSLKRIMARLNAHDGVQRVILGESRSCRHRKAPGTVEIIEVDDWGIRLMAYDEKDKRGMYVKTDNVDAVIRVIEG